MIAANMAVPCERIVVPHKNELLVLNEPLMRQWNIGVVNVNGIVRSPLEIHPLISPLGENTVIADDTWIPEADLKPEERAAFAQIAQAKSLIELMTQQALYKGDNLQVNRLNLERDFVDYTQTLMVVLALNARGKLPFLDIPQSTGESEPNGSLVNNTSQVAALENIMPADKSDDAKPKRTIKPITIGARGSGIPKTAWLGVALIVIEELLAGCAPQ